MVNQIYPPELQLKKANTTDTEAPFLDLLLLQMDFFRVINAMTMILIIVNSPFSDGDVPRRASYGVYISQLIRFARSAIM